jgi:hypothetical protein
VAHLAVPIAREQDQIDNSFYSIIILALTEEASIGQVLARRSFLLVL